MTLAEQARAAGIGVEERPCDQCGGVMLYPDPLDLKRRRLKHASRAAFARSVRKPDGSTGCAVSFIVMVEEVDPDKKRSRRCPEWLLAEYIRLPEMGLSPVDSERLGRFVEAGLASARSRRKGRGERVAKGQVWRKESGGDAPPVQVEILQVIPKGAAPETALVKRVDLDAQPPYTMSTKALRKAFDNVTEGEG